MALEKISIKGEKEVWEKFSRQVKIDQTTVWKVLKPFLKTYCEKKSKFKKFIGI